MKKLYAFLLPLTILMLISCGQGNDEQQAKADAEKARQDSIAEVAKRDSLFNAAAENINDSTEIVPDTIKR